MSEDDSRPDDSVSVNVELTGSYEDVFSKLDSTSSDSPELEAVTADMATILDVVETIDGGTRSAVAQALPEEMTASYDAEEVVTVLQVLAEYDLVTLDGNTWRPGPALED